MPPSTRYLVVMTPEPVIAPSARRHGVDDEDMLHAYRNATAAWVLDEGLVMLVGPDRSGARCWRSGWSVARRGRP